MSEPQIKKINMIKGLINKKAKKEITLSAILKNPLSRLSPLATSTLSLRGTYKNWRENGC
ncbi:MAG: hypothetical protein M0D57_20125 [Sphingobacteriales bacterium JAD_PAG50586_3]|nr:MAG: hypothetical protein M0D57_20125 [Sphingobacteriales bacterium JAD_PAG50586_3]